MHDADVALRAFSNIADRWHLTRADRAILLAVSPNAVERWQTVARSCEFGHEQYERISYILGIFSGLHALLGDSPLADEWVARPNADFSDRRPLDQMLAGKVSDLAFVRDYIAWWQAGPIVEISNDSVARISRFATQAGGAPMIASTSEDR